MLEERKEVAFMSVRRIISYDRMGYYDRGEMSPEIFENKLDQIQNYYITQDGEIR